MYGRFIELVDKLGILPGFKIVNTADHPDVDGECGRKIRPDPVIYSADVDTSSKMTQFDRVEVNIEFKLHSADPFVDATDQDNLHPFESDTVEGSKTRAQLTDYA
ncbi:hypothetical protein H0H92_001054, partial [Tricholoma furcatifolium]